MTRSFDDSNISLWGQLAILSEINGLRVTLEDRGHISDMRRRRLSPGLTLHDRKAIEGYWEKYREYVAHFFLPLPLGTDTVCVNEHGVSY